MGSASSWVELLIAVIRSGGSPTRVVSKSISVATHQEWSVGQKMLGDWGSNQWAVIQSPMRVTASIGPVKSRLIARPLRCTGRFRP
jgi:hypothetical protein